MDKNYIKDIRLEVSHPSEDPNEPFEVKVWLKDNKPCHMAVSYDTDMACLFKSALQTLSRDNEEVPHCPKCGGLLLAEEDTTIDYPYYCFSCDENYYKCETI